MERQIAERDAVIARRTALTERALALSERVVAAAEAGTPQEQKSFWRRLFWG